MKFQENISRPCIRVIDARARYRAAARRLRNTGVKYSGSFLRNFIDTCSGSFKAVTGEQMSGSDEAN